MNQEKGYFKLTIAIIILIIFGLGAYIAKKNYFNKVSLPQTSQPSEAVVSPQIFEDSKAENYTWEISEIASGLDIPWDLALSRDGDIFITERGGKVKILENGQIKEIADFPQVAQIGESGMTGLALHPNFSENGFLFIYYTYRKGGRISNRISRFHFNGEKLVQEKIILDNIPGGLIHNGGRMKFGPDGKLWATTGDASNGGLAQNIKSLAGKILRMNEDGSVPGDNPFPDSVIYSTGHRNPQGIDFHPLTGEIVVTSHGSSAYDEVNIISAGSNHGWPEINKCFSDNPEYADPVLCSMNETWAPSGAAFLGTKILKFRNSYFFAGLRGELLERVEIVNGKAGGRETIIKGDYGRLRAVIADGEGNLLVTTSNRDGRGKIREGDDKILKITPKKVE